MYPNVQRSEPQHRQIADHYSALITAGAEGFRPGDKLPATRVAAAELHVSTQTVAHAYELLKSSRLVETNNQGTFVARPRNTLGPDARLLADRYPAGEDVEVTAAGLVLASGSFGYIRGILKLDLSSGGQVIRREEIVSDDGGPYILRVTWVPPRYGHPSVAPELLAGEPLPDPAGSAHLIAARTGQAITWGDQAEEAREVRADGREDAIFGAGAHILAKTWAFGTAEDTLEYTEQATGEGRVIKTRLVIG